MAGVEVKQEYVELVTNNNHNTTKTKPHDVPVIDLASSDDDDVSSSGDGNSNGKRSRVLNGEVDSSNKRKKPGDGVVLPVGFLDPLPPKDATMQRSKASSELLSCNKQFWKAGDFEGRSSGDWSVSSGMVIVLIV